MKTSSLMKSVVVATSMLCATTAFAQWKPERPITIIVPWSAGGSTDQVTRVVAPILSEELGVEVIVFNSPGESGATGTKIALDAPRDGYTWTANAIANNATYAVSGLLEDTSIKDYAVYLHIANAPMISVHPDAPYANFGEYLEALRGGEVTVGTAGPNSSGGMALAAIRDAAGGEFGARSVAFDGGAPAVDAAVAGEVVSTTQLAVEQTEAARAGLLRPLAVLSDTPLLVEGLDPIPPITNWLPDIPVAADFFGVFIPVGAPQEVYDTMDEIWERRISGSPELQEYAAKQGAVFYPSYGEEAVDRSMPVVILEACARVERGEAVVDPSEFGIPCEAGIESAGFETLRGVRFDTNSAELNDDSKETLENLNEMLTENPEMKLILEGHTDSVGPAAYNQDLSVRRAASVEAWLLSKGINGARLSITGKGETEPSSDNETLQGRALNRRVVAITDE